MPEYDGVRWVQLHQDREWREIIGLWRIVNGQMLSVVENIPDAAWPRICTIAGSEPLTIRFIFQGYAKHMLHHLRQIGVATDNISSVV